MSCSGTSGLSAPRWQAAADEDAGLQDLIGEFNLKRIALNNESTKEEKDGDKITRLDGEIREVYDKIMQNPG